jgi:hypothetical protein
MFKILGADGKEYGPVTVAQIKKWVSEGRANQETMAQPAGETTWKPIGQYPEFADELAAPPPLVAPGPIGAPAAPGAAGGTDSGARARAMEMVSGPAIGLIVTAILGLSASVIGIVWVVFGMGFAPPLHGMTPEAARVFRLIMGPVGIAARGIGIVVCLLILFGALRMQKLTNYGLALTAAIVAMVPCISPCCLIGLPIGIWALVVLGKPEVKSQFH